MTDQPVFKLAMNGRMVWRKPAISDAQVDQAIENLKLAPPSQPGYRAFRRLLETMGYSAMEVDSLIAIRRIAGRAESLIVAANLLKIRRGV